ncbi:DnaB-like helicase C-terminal domain-containing protein [Nonomuraea sp. SYSU D8015]|uniref:DnaB-like helicase C-terminal domain-containing protein n=1 Tax=Nonomuraea sp. SYSU D8015 TaxID=2593644 RepID=UPI001660ACFC|nr:DnaB-like helicase C-terminal domain-containing protein [Nonomuraea sp. SYSU D8015]
MDIFRQIISHTVWADGLKAAVDAGVKREWFADPAAQDAWDFILEYYGRYGKVPSQRVFASEYPNYELDSELEPLEYVLEQARDKRTGFLLDTAVYRAAHDLQAGNTQGALKGLAAAVAGVMADVPTSVAVDVTANGQERLDRYQELRDHDGALKGITTGFQLLNEAIGGWRGGNFVVFGGRPKSGKSTFLLLAAIAAWKAGKKILFVGFEMSREEQEERLDAIEAMVAHNALRDGSLALKEFRKVERAVRGMELFPNFWLATDPDTSTTPSGILAMADMLKPDLIVVDGLYMMQDDLGEDVGSDKALRHICAHLKFGAMRRNIPILASTQMLQSKMHGEEVTLASFGYSSGFQQWADVLIGVQVTEDPIIAMIKILACRNGSPMDFWFYRNWVQGKFYELEHNPFGDDDDADDNHGF